MLELISTIQTGMLQDQARLLSISQNVSNMHTPGYKRQILESSSFDKALQSLENSQQGTLVQTKNQYDLALTDTGFFEVQSEKNLLYTRRGDFHINAQAMLSTATGELVQGRGGNIQINNPDFTVDSDGNIYSANILVDKLNVVQFKTPETLEYLGQGLYSSTEISDFNLSDTKVIQGSLEQANVKSIDEMINLLKTSRHFEAMQKIMKTANHLITTAINQLGEGNV
jgi:flagellar basal body rod protein FlgG